MKMIRQLFKELKENQDWEVYVQLRDSSFQQEILQSGNPNLIADYFHTIDEPIETVIEHFGEGSLEHLACQRITDNLDALFVKTCSPKRKYNVPRRIEDPTLTRGMLRQFLIDFHKYNDMPLSPGFWKRNKKQLLGMYHGMKRDGYFRREIMETGG